MSICINDSWEIVFATILMVLPWILLAKEIKKVRVLKWCWIKMSDFSIASLDDVANELSFSSDGDPFRHSYTLNERAKLWGDLVDEHGRLQSSAGIRNSTLREPYRT